MTLAMETAFMVTPAFPSPAYSTLAGRQSPYHLILRICRYANAFSLAEAWMGSHSVSLSWFHVF